MLTIRRETPGDRAAIFRVHAAAFPTELEARLVDALREAGIATVSLVAELDRAVVGHVLLTPVTVELRGPRDGVGLAPLGVLPAHQRAGIGAQLLRAGIEACRRAGLGFIVVLGEPGYYARFGFVRASGFGLGNEYGVDEPFMALGLRPDALKDVRGIVRFAPPFAAAEPPPAASTPR